MGKQLYPEGVRGAKLVSMSKLPRGLEVTIEKVFDYRDSVKPGDVVNGPQGKRVVIFEKHRYIALTDKGALQWVDLYMFNVRKVDFTETDYTYFER